MQFAIAANQRSPNTIAHVCILTETVLARTCTHPVLCLHIAYINVHRLSMNKPRRVESGRAAFYANSALLQPRLLRRRQFSLQFSSVCAFYYRVMNKFAHADEYAAAINK